MTSRAEARLSSVIAAVGLALVAAIGVLGAGDGEGPDLRGRLAVGSLLVASCLVGTSLALRPGWYRRAAPAGGGEGPRDRRVPTEGPRRVGHHPDCEGFSGHTVRLMGTRCAGCTGLAIGAALVVPLTGAFVLSPDAVAPRGLAWAALAAGLVLVASGLLQAVLPLGAWPRVAVNALLVVGSYLAVTGIAVLTGRWDAGLVTALVTLAWMDTRIRLSQWRHAEVCRSCPEACKAYFL